METRVLPQREVEVGAEGVLEVGTPLSSSAKHCVTLGQSGCLPDSINGQPGWLISRNVSSEPGCFFPPPPHKYPLWSVSPESSAP